MGLNGVLIKRPGTVKEIKIKRMLRKKKELYFVREAKTSSQHSRSS